MRFAYRMHPIFFPHSTTDFVSLRGFVTPRKEETLCSPDSPASHIQVVKKKKSYWLVLWPPLSLEFRMLGPAACTTPRLQVAAVELATL
jgi:hypothetical protein